MFYNARYTFTLMLFVSLVILSRCCYFFIVILFIMLTLLTMYHILRFIKYVIFFILFMKCFLVEIVNKIFPTRFSEKFFFTYYIAVVRILYGTRLFSLLPIKSTLLCLTFSFNM